MKSGMTTLNLHLLDVACNPLWRAVGPTYLVGTAESGGPYRDVDVRTILDDSEFDLLFGDDNGPHRWELMCVSIGLLLAQQTGLPIDYQIQRMSEANAKYDGPRNPVGRKRNFAAFGDATPWTPKPPYEQPSPEVNISKSPVCTRCGRSWAAREGRG